jgi:hypothetical protein
MQYRQLCDIRMHFNHRRSVHGLQKLRGWVACDHRLQCHVGRRMSGVRLRIDLFHHNQRCHLPIMHPMRTWNILPRSMHFNLQRRVHGLHNLRGWVARGHRLRRHIRYSMSTVCLWINVFHND